MRSGIVKFTSSTPSIEEIYRIICEISGEEIDIKKTVDGES